MIDNASIESLKQTIDIVDVVGNYIELKKAGANYKANCPFHGEKTPSFVVSPAKQIYHCFGCGAGGDAIRFVMEMEKLTYPEAIEKLASMYNFSLRYTQGRSDFSGTRRVLERMQEWYVENLEKHAFAKAYLKERGVSQASIERFGIGYVPASSEVMRFIDAASLPRPQAMEAGVLAKGDRGIYPRLTERVTFPIFAPAGGIVGFGGRTLGNHPAKYINSPQTKLFNKSRLLYGYHLAKATIYKHRRLIVCEGYLDVIMFHQAGFTEAVATLGTALTADHLPLLRKGEPEIVLAYDGDNAGVEAALKAAKMLVAAGFEGGVVLFPEGKDPADMIAKGEREEVGRLLRHKRSFIAFVLEETIGCYDLYDPYAKQRALDEVRAFLGTLSDILRESAATQAAALLGVAPGMIADARKTVRTVGETQRPAKDIAVLALLKTMAEKPQLADMAVEVTHEKIFGVYAKLFRAVVSGNNEDTSVQALLLDETIATLEEEAFKSTLRTLMIRYYEGVLKRLARDTRIAYEKRSFMIRKIRADILPRLRKGEWIVFDEKLFEV